MELEESPLYNEVKLIMEDGAKPIAYYWEGEIHTPEKYKFHLDTIDKIIPEGNIDILKIISIDNVCNFETNIGDELVIETLVPFGVYVKHIYPNRAKLEITLFKNPLLEIGDEDKKDELKESERYKAVPILEGLPSFEGTDMDAFDEFTLNLQTPLTISFQLFNRSLEVLRTITVGGIFRKVINEDVIKAILTKESLRLKIEGKQAIEGMNIVESDNKTVRDHTIIPQGVRLIALPTYVQEKCNGVYNFGIGTYLQRKIWYVYPLYNTSRFNDADQKIIIYKIKRSRSNGMERTYRIDGKTSYILATSDSKFQDDANTNFMNEGNGVRLANAKSFMNQPSQSSNNKTMMNRKSLNSEIVFGEKEDGLNSVYQSNDSIGDNIFLERTRISARDGAIMSFTWDNADPKILQPGMVVKILYMDNDVMQEFNGVLLSAQVFVQLNGQGLSIKRHITTCHLSIFVNKVKK